MFRNGTTAAPPLRPPVRYVGLGPVGVLRETLRNQCDGNPKRNPLTLTHRNFLGSHARTQPSFFLGVFSAGSVSGLCDDQGSSSSAGNYE